ncbi:beta-L-arabinofuranosidase domain-containing protein [Bifidobacterium simiiventris]|uniref:beta-L-arabinofuranosidase domain-containing protein n=1 Tax=Bifidobacterium simiiventris TaxID=2834434 RepID=UPI001C57DA13|nr:beta-L-arabinofuranosidase domain-containing protein [Bifidobacterium simiiventris]MBW3077617.1 glycoside hydrolase family 127 protein [Bifidobacterium simiiventris]
MADTNATDQRIADKDAQLLYIGNTGTVEFDLDLPASGANGSTITWSSDDERWIRPDGTVHQPEYGRGYRDVTLTATVTYGMASATRTFTVRVLEQHNTVAIRSVFPVSLTVRSGEPYALPTYTAARTEDGMTISQRIAWHDGVEHTAPRLPHDGGHRRDVRWHGVVDGTDVAVTAIVHVVDQDSQPREDTADRRTPVPLGHVRLTGDGVLARNQRHRLAYLRGVDDDRLLVEFRRAAGLDTRGAQPMTGWDAPDSLLRGHTTGHTLSAYALAYAASGDVAIKAKLEYVVASLAEVQRAFAARPGAEPGFLSAYDETQFDRLEELAPYPTIWAPYYTLHKILAGLLDAYRYAGSRQALDVARGIGDWTYERLHRLDHERLQRMWSLYIAGEFGGMNDALADLYAATGDERHLAAACLFDNDRLMEPLRQHVDALGGMHANQHIPQVIGAVKLFEATGLPHYLDQARFFADAVLGHHLYAMGGTGQGEMFHQPDEIGSLLADDTAESCASYNLVKLAVELERHCSEPRYADYVEHASVNHIAATCDHRGDRADDGGSIYFMPTQPGGRKQFDPDENSCCHGTGLESHFYAAHGAYFTDKDALYVRRYLNGTLDDDAARLTVTADDVLPERVTIRIDRLDRATLCLRVPDWSAGSQIDLRVDGRKVPFGVIELSRSEIGELSFTANALGLDSWDGARLDVMFAPHVRLLPTPDRPEVAAVAWGPYVLAALDKRADMLDVPIDDADPDAAFERSGSKLAFTHRLTGLKFVPLFMIEDEPYHLYVRTR